MGKLAFIFPGQGSQYPGMGKSLYDNFPEAKEVFELADSTLGFSIKDLCFEGSEAELKKTENTQPALLTVSTAALRVLEAKNIKAEGFAGHSLGEYSALVGAGILDFASALKLVCERGELMANADPDGKGGMAAIIGLDPEELETFISKTAHLGKIEAANFNCPGQIVVSGEKAAIEQAEGIAEELGAMRYVVLEVSGPFHSSFMKASGETFKASLDSAPFQASNASVVSNVTAQWSSQEQMADLLSKQIYSPVKWTDSILFMKEQGFDSFIEVGPGKVLRGLMRRIDKKLSVSNVEDIDSMQKVFENFS